LPEVTAFPPCCCWPFTYPFAPLVCPELPFTCEVPSFSEEGGVRSPAPPGKDSDDGEVKAFACCAVDG